MGVDSDTNHGNVCLPRGYICAHTDETLEDPGSWGRLIIYYAARVHPGYIPRKNVSNLEISYVNPRVTNYQGHPGTVRVDFLGYLDIYPRNNVILVSNNIDPGLRHVSGVYFRGVTW
jgi:hypothetical protein